MPVVILEANRQKMLSPLRQQEKRGNYDRGQVAAIHFLAVLEQVNAFVKNPNLCVLCKKYEIGLVDGPDIAVCMDRDIGPRSSHVVGSLAFLAGGKRNRRGKEQKEYRPGAHPL